MSNDALRRATEEIAERARIVFEPDPLTEFGAVETEFLRSAGVKPSLGPAFTCEMAPMTRWRWVKAGCRYWWRRLTA